MCPATVFLSKLAEWKQVKEEERLFSRIKLAEEEEGASKKINKQDGWKKMAVPKPLPLPAPPLLVSVPLTTKTSTQVQAWLGGDPRGRSVFSVRDWWSLSGIR